MKNVPGRCRERVAAVLLVPAITLAVLCGCSRRASAPKSGDFFVTWLKSHGESNIVVDKNGVGLAGNPTRLSSTIFGVETHTNGVTVELEFRVRIPDGREIVEFVAGSGDSIEKAADDAKVNFVVSTFHVLYRSFLNPNDPHQLEEKITIGGQPRVLVLGDTMTRSQSTNSMPNLAEFRERFRNILASQSLSPQTHWLKVIYANHRSKAMLCAVTLDNEDSPALTAAVQNLPWSKPDEFYMVKQFVVVK